MRDIRETYAEAQLAKRGENMIHNVHNASVWAQGHCCAEHAGLADSYREAFEAMYAVCIRVSYIRELPQLKARATAALALADKAEKP